MPPIVASTEVNRSAEDVFAYATDPTRFGEWQKGVVDGHMEGPAVQAPGARCVTTRGIGFANRPAIAEVTHFDPPSTWAVRGIDGPIRARVEVTVEPIADARSRVEMPSTSRVTALARCSFRWWSAAKPERRCRATWRC
ncbi:MAG: SRPBCC family protein [Acidimicrobiales bacterium]